MKRKRAPRINRAINMHKTADELEAVLTRRFGGKCAMVVIFALPSEGFGDPHWATNVDRPLGIKVCQNTAREIEKQAAGQEQPSALGDLSDLAEELERLLRRKFRERPLLAVTFALPGDHETVHWVTNSTPKAGVELLQGAARKMAVTMN